MNNPQAFPVPAELCQDLTVYEQRGMTLRDYFAAKAMQELVKTFAPSDCARKAYAHAEEMLKARR